MAFMKLLLILAVSMTAVHVARSDCEIDIKSESLNRAQPLILKTGPTLQLNVFGFYLPDDTGKIRIPTGTVIRLACPGKFNYFNLYTKEENVKEVDATCISGMDFKILNVQKQYTEMFCFESPIHTPVETNEHCDGGTGTDVKKINIGFFVDQDFYITVEICFDSKLLIPLWSKHDLVKEITGAVSIKNTPSFSKNPYYTKENMDKLFKTKTQAATFGAILETGTTSTYITSTMHLTRGHLAPSSGFVYAAQKRSTYYHINEAPQWETVNNGNWAQLETSLGRMVSKDKLDLCVYTGTYGTLILDTKEIYLNYTKKTDTGIETKRIPVPELYWKVVYDTSSKLAVAIITLNNPHVVESYVDFVEKYAFTPIDCVTITWITNWNKSDKSKGYSYCFTVAEFRRVVKSLPNFEVIGLLTG